MNLKMNNENTLLLGRLLTRSGDQAWDFAVPLVLLQLFPGKLQIAAIYYLFTKLITLIFTPRVGRFIDHSSRKKTLFTGIIIQFIAVMFSLFVFIWAETQKLAGGLETLSSFWIFIIGLIIFGSFASLGSLITDISTTGDIAVELIEEKNLSSFNAKIKRIDLSTEVLSPIVAGLIMAVSFKVSLIFGFYIIGIWNLISFFPEFYLMNKILSRTKEKVISLTQVKFNLKDVFGIDFNDPVIFILISYALLWLSVLSPHGVLLTGYLKDQYKLNEVALGFFRGIGAIFGILSTLTFPYVRNKIGLRKSMFAHILFQFICLSLGILFMEKSIWFFLIMILFSRIGLYGFSIGEQEIRQLTIKNGERGRINSFASFLTTTATLVVFLFGSFMGETKSFSSLIHISIGAIFFSIVFYLLWLQKQFKITE
jgi:iron-regulated transporter 1